jgi:hypothetical protein
MTELYADPSLREGNSPPSYGTGLSVGKIPLRQRSTHLSHGAWLPPPFAAPSFGEQGIAPPHHSLDASQPTTGPSSAHPAAPLHRDSSIEGLDLSQPKISEGFSPFASYYSLLDDQSREPPPGGPDLPMKHRDSPGPRSAAEQPPAQSTASTVVWPTPAVTFLARSMNLPPTRFFSSAGLGSTSSPGPPGTGELGGGPALPTAGSSAFSADLGGEGPLAQLAALCTAERNTLQPVSAATQAQPFSSGWENRPQQVLLHPLPRAGPGYSSFSAVPHRQLCGPAEEASWNPALGWREPASSAAHPGYPPVPTTAGLGRLPVPIPSRSWGKLLFAVRVGRKRT